MSFPTFFRDSIFFVISPFHKNTLMSFCFYLLLQVIKETINCGTYNDDTHEKSRKKIVKHFKPTMRRSNKQGVQSLLNRITYGGQLSAHKHCLR